MLFVIHVTLVDGVAGFFFNGIALVCGWRLLDVNTLPALTKKKPTSISGDILLPPRPEWHQHEIRTEPSFLLENGRHYVPESVDTLNSSTELCSSFDVDEMLA